MEDTLRGQSFKVVKVDICLNPCFNGRYSQRIKKVRVEDPKAVLILVLMEDTLRVKKVRVEDPKTFCLNPCFNGRYSQRNNFSVTGYICKVLILVLMEDTLRDK